MANEIQETWLKKAESIGYNAAATLLNSLYPREFECYMIAFELCDSKGKTLDYFTFPIMPSEISITEGFATKVQNSFGGVSSISSSVYIPKDISLSGNFGRNFKVLYRGKLTLPFVSKSEVERNYGFDSPLKIKELSNTLKTGYGCIKVLQSILNRSVGIDEYGDCNRLYFYNLVFGESYLVKVNSFTPSQDMSTNAIWRYNLKLKTVCPIHLDKYAKQKGKVASTLNSVIQSGLNSLASGIKNSL